MALPDITVDDFKGVVKITANTFKQQDLTEYIDTFYPDYLRQIIGQEAYSIIENQDRQKWTDLFEGVSFVNVTDNKTYFFNGLFRPLIYFIYFEFVRDNFNSTQSGKVRGRAENSERLGALEVIGIARSRYNLAVRTTNVLTQFLKANAQFEEVVTNSVDNADNSYTLSIANTKYLEDGDSVTIDGTAYPISNLVENTSIDIDAGTTGLDFLNDSVIWKPYGAVNFCEMEIIGI
jgi:hypothetical protein